ncbi:MAG: hypothetical protein K9L59_14150 [Desulfobacterales bacterium]|nr:hypothetical protein [Desulfobacterales bacterium]
MLELKKLSMEAIPQALEKAERYRLLKEPYNAESICQDILRVDPDNQQAMNILILAITDKFDQKLSAEFAKAKEVLERLSDRYCKAYYRGIIFERRAKAHLKNDQHGAGEMAYGWLIKAMDSYDEALTFCNPDNQDAVLRWNTCARIINETPHVLPPKQDTEEEMLDTF